ncbi:MAG: hypothetical protein ACTSV3_03365 [Candidatus Thorarchaeota archaeon]|nr:MAG: hypothetical protein DRP09_01970 [Candidatus Thorarchaeota archaeon]RLI59551.1 MAG: hypothetical protein DRO87_02520 [Candidatus Thorarchaeota archaeon]
MAASGSCRFYKLDGDRHYCRLRGQTLNKAEVSDKCIDSDLSTICVDAYSSLSRGQDALSNNSTDAFPWLVEAATQFENLGETDNAIHAYVRAIEFAIKNDLTERAYDFFRSARNVFENGLERKDPTLTDPMVKHSLMKAGQSIIERVRRITESTPMTDMQAELKAAVLGGISLKKVEKKDEMKDLIISHGRSLYEKKGEEYKAGAQSYIDSGMIKNSVVLTCMGALSDLMLGRPKEGMAYLAEVASKPEHTQTFNEHPCFEWTKLIFRILVSRDSNLLVTAHKLFLKIPWSFKDDREFARRVMESVERRITAQS